MLAEGGWCDSDLDPRLFLWAARLRSYGGKCKNTLTFRIRSTCGRWPLLGMEAKERSIYQKPDTIRQVYGIWRTTRLAMPKTINAPDSSSLEPGSGATEGVLD